MAPCGKQTGKRKVLKDAPRHGEDDGRVFGVEHLLLSLESGVLGGGLGGLRRGIGQPGGVIRRKNGGEMEEGMEGFL